MMPVRTAGSVFIVLILLAAGCTNPFAPKLDTSASGSSGILVDQHRIEGVFLNFKQAYAYRDTTFYGQVLAPDFIFVYRDYDKGADVFWGRDDDLRTTEGLFQNVQRLDLVWNSVISQSVEADSLKATVLRNFNLTVTFSANDIVRVDGYANWTLQRARIEDDWKIVRWRDESNF